jgi:hypothetical protein
MIDFLHAHPWISLLALIIVANMPVQIIQALKNKRTDTDNE